MSRTIRRDDRCHKDVRDGEQTSHHWKKENKYIRIQHAREVRRETKRALEQGEHDVLPDYPHTSGWETH